MQIHPYLNFNGNCREAFEFYAKCLGGTIEAIMTNGEMPGAEEMSDEQKAGVMHARMKVGDSILMASDAPANYYQTPAGTHISLHVSTVEEADRIFGELSENGTVQMPIQSTFWAARFGMTVDKFGIPWMVNCEKAA